MATDTVYAQATIRMTVMNWLNGASWPAAAVKVFRKSRPANTCMNSFAYIDSSTIRMALKQFNKVAGYSKRGIERHSNYCWFTLAYYSS